MAMSESTAGDPLQPALEQSVVLASTTRRSVLIGAAALSVAGYLPPLSEAATKSSKQPAGLAPNHFVRIGADDSVTVICKHLEMGQGVFTGLATIVAEGC
jgi:isoquinoline 1-oxidoreductase subunit beta